jgi:hypothetical protein
VWLGFRQTIGGEGRGLRGKEGRRFRVPAIRSCQQRLQEDVAGGGIGEVTEI